MTLIDWVIVGVYLLTLSEITVSGVWRTERSDVDAMKVLTVTMILVSVFTLSLVLGLNFLLRGQDLPEVVNHLVAAQAFLVALLIHQTIFSINRRRIKEPRTSRGRDPWRWFWNPKK